MDPFVVAAAGILEALAVGALDRFGGPGRAQREHRGDGQRDPGSNDRVAHSTLLLWFMENLLLDCQSTVGRRESITSVSRTDQAQRFQAQKLARLIKSLKACSRSGPRHQERYFAGRYSAASAGERGERQSLLVGVA